MMMLVSPPSSPRVSSLPFSDVEPKGKSTGNVEQGKKDDGDDEEDGEVQLLHLLRQVGLVTT